MSSEMKYEGEQYGGGQKKGVCLGECSEKKSETQ